MGCGTTDNNLARWFLIMNNSLNEILWLYRKALDGGKGSGNFGHKGRPGKRGGSGKGVNKVLDDNQINAIWEEYVKRVNALGENDQYGWAYGWISQKGWDKDRNSAKQLLNNIIETGIGIFKTDEDVDKAEKQYEEAIKNGDKKTAEKIKKILRWNMTIEAMYDVASEMYGEEIKDIQNNNSDKNEPKQEHINNKKDLSKGYDITNDTDIFNEKGEAKIEFNDISANAFNNKIIKDFIGSDFNDDRADRFRQIIELNKSQFINFMNNKELHSKYEGMTDILKEQILDSNSIGLFLDYPSILPDKTKNLYFALAKDIIGDNNYLEEMDEVKIVEPYIPTQHMKKQKGSFVIIDTPSLFYLSDIMKDNPQLQEFIERNGFEMYQLDIKKGVYLDMKESIEYLKRFGLGSSTANITKEKIEEVKSDVLTEPFSDIREAAYTYLLLDLLEKGEISRVPHELGYFCRDLIKDVRNRYTTDYFDIELNIPEIQGIKNVNGFLGYNFKPKDNVYTSSIFSKPCELDLKYLKDEMVDNKSSVTYLGVNAQLLYQNMQDLGVEQFIKNMKDKEEREKALNEFLDIIYNDGDADAFYSKYNKDFGPELKGQWDLIKTSAPVMIYNEDVNTKLAKQNYQDDIVYSNTTTYFATLLGQYYKLDGQNLYNSLGSFIMSQLTSRFRSSAFSDNDNYINMPDEKLDSYLNNVDIGNEHSLEIACKCLAVKDMRKNGFDKELSKVKTKEDFFNILSKISEKMQDGSYHISKDNEYSKIYEVDCFQDEVKQNISGDLIKTDTTELDNDIDFISGIQYDIGWTSGYIRQVLENSGLYNNHMGFIEEEEVLKKRLYKKKFLQSEKAKKLIEPCLSSIADELVKDFNYAAAKKAPSVYLKDFLRKKLIMPAFKEKKYDEAALYVLAYIAMSSFKDINIDNINSFVSGSRKGDVNKKNELREGFINGYRYIYDKSVKDDTYKNIFVRNPNIDRFNINKENIISSIKSNRINERYQKIKNKPDIKTNFLDTTVIKDVKLDKKWSPQQALDFIKKLVPCLNLPNNFYRSLIRGREVATKQMGESYIDDAARREFLMTTYKTDSSFAKIRQEYANHGEAEPVMEKIRSNFKNKYIYNYDDVRSLISYITTNGSYYTSALQEDNEGMGSFMRMLVASSPVVNGEFCRFENPADTYRMYGDIKVGDSITMNAQHFTYDAKSFGEQACKYFGKQCFRVKGEVPFLNMMPYVRPKKLTEWEGLIAGCFKVVKITKGQKIYNAFPDVIYDLEFDWDKWKSYIHANSKLFANQIGLYDRNGKMKVKDFLNNLLKIRLLRFR